MNKKISFPIAIIIIVVCAGLVGLITWQYRFIPGIKPSGPSPTPSGKSCEQLYEEIENDFDKANYCEQDSDCKAIQLGGAYVEFGCFKYVNKEIDENKLLKRVEEYDKRCGPAIDKCALAPQSTCVSGKCVYVKPASIPAQPSSSIKILSPQSPDLSPQSPDKILILINGSSVNIEWESENIGPLDVNIKLIYSTDRISNIVSNIPNTTKSYQWTIPQDIEPGIYRISVGTADGLESYDLGSTFDISDYFIISPTTSIKPIINSLSPQEVSIGSTIIITGDNFDPIGGTATIGWASHSHIYVYIKNTLGEQGILFEAVWHPAKDPITITIPSNACTVSRDAGFCSPIPITPGQYSLSVSVDGRGTSNTVSISIR